MIVYKFGGTSVGSAERIRSVAKLITRDDEPKIVVLSAMSGTTNTLFEIVNYLYKGIREGAVDTINNLEKHYKQTVKDLFTSSEYQEKALQVVETHINHIRAFFHDMFTIFEERTVVAQGELISTQFLHLYLEEQGHDAQWLPALNFMRIDKTGDPDHFYIRQNLEREIESYPEKQLFITQGFICRNVYGDIDNLKRGGSDYSASLIGAAIKAKEIQIWTDIDGLHNNDPRFVESTRPVAQLSFEEAAELAYFGAKILHPASVLPAKIADIPVRLKNTLNPDAPGTVITNEPPTKGIIRAVAAKDGITAVKIRSDRMLLAYGFLRKIFEVFESYETPIDMIATSEVAVSLTIDEDKYLNRIVEELKNYGKVELDTDLSIVCVVGDFIAENKGVINRVTNALCSVPLRMVSYGGSNNNISLLIQTKDKKEALKALSDSLFNK